MARTRKQGKAICRWHKPCMKEWSYSLPSSMDGRLASLRPSSAFVQGHRRADSFPVGEGAGVIHVADEAHAFRRKVQAVIPGLAESPIGRSEYECGGPELDVGAAGHVESLESIGVAVARSRGPAVVRERRRVFGSGLIDGYQRGRTGLLVPLAGDVAGGARGCDRQQGQRGKDSPHWVAHVVSPDCGYGGSARYLD